MASLFKNLLGTTLDLFKVGRGVAGDKKLIFNNADANKPELRFDDTAKKWKFSNNGVDFVELPSDLTASTLPNEETFSTTTANLEGATVTETLTQRPGVTSYMPSGYAIIVERNGVKMTYSATLSTVHQFKYNSSLNRVEILASGQADDYAVFYLSKGTYQNLDSLVPDWTQSNWLDKWSDVQSYVIKKRDAGSLPHAVTAYAHGVTAVAGAYMGGVLARDRIWLVPYNQADVGTWHYIEISTGNVVAYTHGLGGDTPVDAAYVGGVLSPNGRIYLVPSVQSNQTKWHYINSATGAVVAYAHGLGADTPVASAYYGGILAPNGRIYLVPLAQSNQTKWHYIDTATGNVVAYAHGLGADTPVANAYGGGVLAPNGRIYLAPLGQSNQTKWHYIDTATGNVVAYAHGVTCVSGAYAGGVLAPNGRVYLVPNAQSNQANWHYIDTSTGSVVPYVHGATCVQYAYQTGLLGVNGRIYLGPDSQSNQTNWHYIDTATGSVVAYTHGVTAVANAYVGGVSINNGKIYLIPYQQANQTSWHYIDTKPNSPWNTNMCTNPMFNKY